MNKTYSLVRGNDLGVCKNKQRLKKGRADIYFSRSVGKDIPARPTLLVVCRDSTALSVRRQYASEQFSSGKT